MTELEVRAEGIQQNYLKLDFKAVEAYYEYLQCEKLAKTTRRECEWLKSKWRYADKLTKEEFAKVEQAKILVRAERAKANLT